MTFQTRIVPILVGLVLSASICWSYPTIFGDSGLVTTPTADVMPFLNLEVAFDYARVNIGEHSATAVPIRVNYGISDNVELFGVYSDSNSTNGYDVLGGGAKIQLAKQSLEQFVPSFAVGARVLRMDNAIERDVATVYAVSSATMLRMGNYPEEGYRLRAHLGVEYNSISGELPGKNFVTPFVGASYENKGGSSLVVDYLPRLRDNGIDYRSATFSAAMRLPVSRIFVFEFGGTRPFGIGDTSIYAGVMYHYGFGKDVSSVDPLLEYTPAVVEY